METNELPEQSKTQEYFLANLEATLIKIINLHPNSYEYNDVREFCNRIRRWVNQDCQSLLQQRDEQLKAKDEEIAKLKLLGNIDKGIAEAEKENSDNIYISAVQGRKAFRQAYRDALTKIDSLTSEVERLKEALKKVREVIDRELIVVPSWEARKQLLVEIDSLLSQSTDKPNE